MFFRWQEQINMVANIHEELYEVFHEKLLERKILFQGPRGSIISEN
jgi:hypothetical protein